MEDKELKPCPFCGSDSIAEVTDHVNHNTTVYYITCKGPGNLNGYCNMMGQETFSLWN